jgi:hypothetical protein
MTDVAVSLFAIPSLVTWRPRRARSAAKYAVDVGSEFCCLSVSSMAARTTAFYGISRVKFEMDLSHTWYWL